MTPATLTRTAPGPPPRPDEVLQTQQVGPGWEVLLMPAPLGRLVMDLLAGRAARTAPLGWVFAHADHWGIFLPEGSDDPAWPPGTTYLKAGANVTLPPLDLEPAHDRGFGWVSRDGSPLSRPLLLHSVLTALATDQLRPTAAARQSRA